MVRDIKGCKNPMFGKSGVMKGKKYLNSKSQIFIRENTNKHICQCGCNQYIIPARQHLYKNIPKYITGHYLNVKNPNKDGHMTRGKKFTDEHRKNISLNHADFRGKKSSKWNGGKKLSTARQNYKRRHLFGYIFLNNLDQDDWVGHHIDYNYVIFIPEELHKSIYHSVTKNINMDIINDRTYDWFVKYYLVGK